MDHHSDQPCSPKLAPLTRGQRFLVNVALGRRITTPVTKADLASVLIDAAARRIGVVHQPAPKGLRGCRPSLVWVDEAANFPRSEV